MVFLSNPCSLDLCLGVYVEAYLCIRIESDLLFREPLCVPSTP